MNKTFDARTIFAELGAGPAEVQLATQHANYKPVSSAPEMHSTQAIVRSVQRGLRQIGCVVQVTGKIDRSTAYCLSQVAGPEWKHTSWVELGKRIVEMRTLGQKLNRSLLPTDGLGDEEVGFASQAGGLLFMGAVLLVVFKLRPLKG